jgi:hypothetical protein
MAVMAPWKICQGLIQGPYSRQNLRSPFLKIFAPLVWLPRLYAPAGAESPVNNPASMIL